MSARKKVLIVGGTFNETGGKNSFFIDRIRDAFLTTKRFLVTFYNGGKLNIVYEALDEVQYNDVVVWMADIENGYEKILPIIKKKNSKCILVRSKRNDNNKYSTFEIIKRMFDVRANYCIEINKNNGYNFRIVDPLGNCWYDGKSVTEMADIISFITFNVSEMKRFPSIGVFRKRGFSIEDEFIDVVKKTGNTFTEMIREVVNRDRFLGNVSTRCMCGFPSCKNEEKIFVSKRNVEKETISSDDFVEVGLDRNAVCYYGENKPSVDTAVQCMLYRHFNKIRYIIHGHVYVKDGMFTQSHVPCGYVDEFDEIMELNINKNSKLIKINLRGHGCIVMTDEINKFENVEYEPRMFFEYNIW